MLWKECVMLMTAKQMAEYLQVSPRTLDAWRYRGGGPPWIKLRGTQGGVRYDSDELKRWLESQTRYAEPVARGG